MLDYIFTDFIYLLYIYNLLYVIICYYRLYIYIFIVF